MTIGFGRGTAVLDPLLQLSHKILDHDLIRIQNQGAVPGDDTLDVPAWSANDSVVPHQGSSGKADSFLCMQLICLAPNLYRRNVL